MSVTSVSKKYSLRSKTLSLMEALNPLIRAALELKSLLLAQTELTGLVDQVRIRIFACFPNFVYWTDLS